MNFTKFLALLSVLFLFAFCPNKEAYKIFNEKGEYSSYQNLIDEALKADIIFFGESHDNPISHWLEIELTKDLYSKVCNDLMLGAEMFEADDQIVLNEYLGGKYSYDSFKKEAKVWPNNKTDYLPLLEFALENQLSFIATNIPRRYANMVYKDGYKGLNGISEEAKKWMAPLPILYDKDLPGYVKIVQESGGHGGENLPKAQAIKDATMAHFILKNWKKDRKFIHFNGTYHTENFEGIIWYLKQQYPDLKIVTIASVEQEKIDSLEIDNTCLANFIIATPESMTKTY